MNGKELEIIPNLAQLKTSQINLSFQGESPMLDCLPNGSIYRNSNIRLVIETPLPSVYIPKSAGHQLCFGKGCDILNSGRLSEPEISDSVSQIWHMFWYIENIKTLDYLPNSALPAM
jgi:hypothetical protein